MIDANKTAGMAINSDGSEPCNWAAEAPSAAQLGGRSGISQDRAGGLVVPANRDLSNTEEGQRIMRAWSLFEVARRASDADGATDADAESFVLAEAMLADTIHVASAGVVAGGDVLAATDMAKVVMINGRLVFVLAKDQETELRPTLGAERVSVSVVDFGQQEVLFVSGATVGV